METIIDIYHNTTVDPHRMFRERKSGEVPPMQLVHTYDVAHRGPGKDNSDLALCEHAFDLFNAPEDWLYGRDREICEEYRAKGLRSLSVGDVVGIRRPNGDARTYECATMGWTRV